MRKFFVILCAAALALTLLVPAAAEPLISETVEPLISESPYGHESREYGEGYDFSAPDAGGAVVTDWANLLTDAQEAALTAKIETIERDHSFQVVFNTTDGTGGKDIRDYADDFFDYNGFGYGESCDGMVFVVDMESREFWTSTCGSGLIIFPDSAVGSGDADIHRRITPMLSDGDYYGAFDEYLNLADGYLTRAQSGVSDKFGEDGSYYGYIGGEDAPDYDYIGGEDDWNYGADSGGTKARSTLTVEAVVVAVALVVAFIVTRIMKSKMNTAVPKRAAAEYVVPGSMELTGSYERFTHKTVSRTAIPKNTSSSSGGGISGSSGGSHTSSSGRSHGGGGGRF